MFLRFRRIRVVSVRCGGDSGDRGYPIVGSGGSVTVFLKKIIFEDLRIFVIKLSADKDAVRILNKVLSRTYMKN